MCKAESCTTAAGFVLRTVKHRQASYKLVLHGIVYEKEMFATLVFAVVFGYGVGLPWGRI
jgi:hypothetical protein